MTTKQLNCVSCGASLQIPEDIEFLNCTTCGSFLQVLRGDGYWSLKIVEKMSLPTNSALSNDQIASTENEQTVREDLRRIQLNQEYLMLEGKLTALRAEIRSLSQMKQNNELVQKITNMHWQEFNILDSLRILRASITEIDTPDLSQNLYFVQEQLSILEIEIKMVQEYFGQTPEIINLGKNLQNERIKWENVLFLNKSPRKDFDANPQSSSHSNSATQSTSVKESSSNRMRILYWCLGVFGLIVVILGGILFIRQLIENNNSAGIASTEVSSSDVVKIEKNVSSGIGLKEVSSKDGMVMMYVPAGDFIMGLSDEQTDLFNSSCFEYFKSLMQANSTTAINEADLQASCKNQSAFSRPLHTVSMDAFWIDRTEVTNGMFEKCVDDGSCQPPKEGLLNIKNPYWGETEFANYPVVDVDWDQANAYCQWAGRRLPTEAEWEKAARGTDGRTYPWGEGIDCQKANYGSCRRKLAETGISPTGASPYGALDMTGNVSEWVADYFDPSYYQVSPEQNPTGPSIGEGHSIRGYSFIDDNSFDGNAYPTPYYLLNVPYRLGFAADMKMTILGFRCAK